MKHMDIDELANRLNGLGVGSLEPTMARLAVSLLRELAKGEPITHERAIEIGAEHAGTPRVRVSDGPGVPEMGPEQHRAVQPIHGHTHALVRICKRLGGGRVSVQERPHSLDYRGILGALCASSRPATFTDIRKTAVRNCDTLAIKGEIALPGFRKDVEFVVTIQHRNGYTDPVDACEVRCLQEMEKNLKHLGARKGNW